LQAHREHCPAICERDALTAEPPTDVAIWLREVNAVPLKSVGRCASGLAACGMKGDGALALMSKFAH
jgi:hypothetical protein